MSEPGQDSPREESEYEDDEEEQELDIGDEDNNKGPRLSLETKDNEEYDEEEERRKYGLNSPKAKNSDQPTPNTKFRDEAGINSPKLQKKLDWSVTNKDNENDNENEQDNSALQSLVTQVQQPDKNSNPITSVPRDDDSVDKGDVPKEQQPPQSGGFCSCLCNIFSCCSPAPPSTTEEKPRTHIDQNKQSKVNSTSQIETEEQPGTRDTLEESESSEEPTGLLPPLSKDKKGKKCLVLDLDETLVHSSFKPISTADFIIPVEIDNVIHKVYVMKRPFVDEFLIECAKYYEIVIFTASLSKYADPLLDELDKTRCISHRLFRESCVLHGTAYVKDLRKIGRKLKDTIIVDNSAQSYLFQPKSAVPILSWFDDKTDTQLRDFMPVLKTTLFNCKDVRNILDANNKTFKWLCNQANVPLSKFES